MSTITHFLLRPLPPRTWLVALVAAFALAGCGGGGSDGGTATTSTTTTTTSTTIVDSFGQVVAAGGADGVGVGDSGSDGTAGDGAAIVGAVVVVTDASGKTVSGTTDAQGYYRVKVTGFTPPLVAKVTKSDGRTYFSFNTKPLKINGFNTLNITGLTDKVASDVARAAGKVRSSDLTPQIVATNPDAVTQSINSLKATIAPVITASGIDASSFDPLSVPFRPDHTGYDFVLDNTKVTVAADGSTQVAIAPTFSAPGGLAGNWQQTTLVEGQSIVGGVVPASAVPTAQILTQSTAATAATYLAPTNVTANGSTYTVTANGNTTTITGPNTNFTLTINSYSFSNYQGCGSCGVNSTVSVTMNANYTAGGTLDGQSIPTTTASFSATLTWKRVN